MGGIGRVKRERRQALEAGVITAINSSKRGEITGVVLPGEVIHRGCRSVLLKKTKKILFKTQWSR